MSEIKVNSIKGVAASTAAITVNNTDGTCTANITNNLSNRNLIINGAMQVAQRGTSSTTNGFGTVDRFQCLAGNVDEAPTQAQVDVAAGTTPYTNGFRKALKITNGNQTGGAGADDYILVRTTLEAQDLANSGWNYTSSSSYITLSFWIKSSIAQNFYGHIRANDGTSQNYPFETGSLSADTWTKVTKTIPGNSNIQFDNNSSAGMEVNFAAFFGTSYTSGVSVNQWIAYASGNLTPDQTSTWYTTDDATLEMTGFQLEVSDHATDFEHRSFGQELALCQRYHYVLDLGTDSATIHLPMMRRNSSSGVGLAVISFPVEMRNTPSFTFLGSARSSGGYSGDPVAKAATTSAGCIESTNSLSASDIVDLRPYTPDNFLKLVFTAEL